MQPHKVIHQEEDRGKLLSCLPGVLGKSIKGNQSRKHYFQTGHWYCSHPAPHQLQSSVCLQTPPWLATHKRFTKLSLTLFWIFCWKYSIQEFCSFGRSSNIWGPCIYMELPYCIHKVKLPEKIKQWSFYENMNAYLLLATFLPIWIYKYLPPILLISKMFFWCLYQSHKVLIQLTVDCVFPSIVGSWKLTFNIGFQTRTT